MKNIFILIAMFLATSAIAGNDIKTDNKVKAAQEAPALAETGAFMLTGQVTDSATGEPLTGVKISIEGTGIKVYSDFDGRFRMGNLKPGTYQVSASLVSYSNSIIELSASTEKNPDLSLKLKTAY